MSIIEDLKVRLSANIADFDNKIKGSEKRLTAFKSKVNTLGTQATKSFSGLGGSAGSLTKGFTGMIPAVGGASGAVGVLGAVVNTALPPLAALGAALAAFSAVAGSLKWGVQLAAEAETAEVAFTTMTGSADTAKTVLADLTEFAASTPFQLGDIKDSAQQLLAFGFGVDTLMEDMKVLGDVAAGSGKPLIEFVDIVGKVRAKGKASLEEINRLAERSVPIFSLLAEEMGVAESEVASLASTGQIKLPEIQAALKKATSEGGIFNDAMAKQSQTLAGLWSTLKDNTSLIFQEIGTLLVDTFDFHSILEGVTNFIKTGINLFKFWKPVIEQARDVFIDMHMVIVDVAKQIFNLGTTAMQPIISMFPESLLSATKWRDGILTALIYLEYGFTSLRAHIENVFEKIASLGRNWKKALTGDIGQIVADFAMADQKLKQVGSFEDHLAERTNELFGQIGSNQPADKLSAGFVEAMSAADKLGESLREQLADTGMTQLEKDLADIKEQMKGLAGDELAELKDKFLELQNLKAELEIKVTADKAQEELEKTQQSAENLVDQLEQSIITFGMSSQEAEIWRLENRNASAETIAQAKALNAIFESMQEDAKLEKFAEDIKKSLKTPEQEYQESLEKLVQARDAGLLNEDQFTLALEKIEIDEGGSADGTGQAPGVVEFGSAKAFEIIANAQANRADPQLKEAQATRQATEKTAIELQEMRRIMSRKGVLVPAEFN